MPTIHVDQDVNKYLVNAINRLKTLQHVNVTKELTSHYNYGTEEPYIRDRCRIEMGLKTKDIRCQVVFDSSSYYSPPDIIFDKSVNIHEAFDVEEQSALLPADDWDLKDENCLYNWFENLVGRLKEPPKSPSPSPSPPPKMPSSNRRKKNWGIFKPDDDSDDDLIISKEDKTDSDDDFMPTGSKRRSKESSTRNKRPARNQNDREKDTKRPKVIEQIGEFKTHTIIDSDEEMSDMSVDSKQVNKSPCVYTGIELKEKGKAKMEGGTRIDEAKPQRQNPYIDESSAMNFEFDDEPKEIAPKEETKTKPQQRNPYIVETSTFNFGFDDKSNDLESKGEECKAERSSKIEKTKPQKRNPYIAETSAFNFGFDDKSNDLESKNEECKVERRTTNEKTKPQQRNPYIAETSTFNFELDDKPKDTECIKKNPFIDDFEDMEIDKPEAKKPKTIDLMQKTRRLTESPTKVAAMRMQKEAKWGKDFMALWRRKFVQNIMKMDEEDTGTLTLYMPFRIATASDSWERYSEAKQKQLMEFFEAQGMAPKTQTITPKPEAPMLVHLELVSFTRLKVKLISAINTSEQASDGIDSIDLTYSLNQENAVGSELNRIKNDIKEQAIHFHLFQTKLEH